MSTSPSNIELAVDLKLLLPQPSELRHQLLRKRPQVLINLLLNATQASSPAGRIRVFVSTVHAESAAGQCVCFGVTDHGHGIKPEDREKVFAPFFTTKAGGFGLGLAVSQRIVQDHGGEITFTSTPGEETTFVVSIPLTQRADDGPDPSR